MRDGTEEVRGVTKGESYEAQGSRGVGGRRSARLGPFCCPAAYCRLLCAPQEPDCLRVGGVQRPAKAFTPDEIAQARSGEAVNGLRLRLVVGTGPSFQSYPYLDSRWW